MSELTSQDKANCAQLAIRPGWHGPCHKGHQRCVKAVKRREAKQRALATVKARTAA